MKNRNTQSGITLIALVVTIVVLLILAGITIAFVLSDGGIFQAAKDAKVEQMRATIMDYAIQMAPTLTTKYYALGGNTNVYLTNLDLQKFFPGFKVIEKEHAWTVGTDGKVFRGGFYVVPDEGYEISSFEDLSTIDGDKIFTVNFEENGQVRVEKGIQDVPMMPEPK